MFGTEWGVAESFVRMSDMNDPSGDESLVRRLRLKDEAALALVLDRWGSRMASTIRGTWPAISDAELEELAADVLADAWFRVDEIDLARGSLATWLLMRARYRTLDRLRALRRDRSLVARISRSRAATDVPEYPSDFESYLAGLTELERDLVQLRFVERRTVLEVARRLGRSPKAVEHRLVRLRRDLRLRIAVSEERGPGHG
jgi:RNA polymerase sigma factor (sigma-70 family)